jgi:hypothetical protein
VFTPLEIGIDPTVHAQTAWTDDDGDGDLDLFVANVDNFLFQESFIRRYENQAGTFTGTDLLGIKINLGAADWGDYDGDMDIVVAGNIQAEDGTFATVLRVYRNDGGGVYFPIAMSLPGFCRPRMPSRVSR